MSFSDTLALYYTKVLSNKFMAGLSNNPGKAVPVLQ